MEQGTVCANFLLKIMSLTQGTKQGFVILTLPPFHLKIFWTLWTLPDFTYQSNVNSEFHANANRSNQDNHRHCTQLYSNKTHHAKQLHSHQSQHHHLEGFKQLLVTSHTPDKWRKTFQKNTVTIKHSPQSHPVFPKTSCLSLFHCAQWQQLAKEPVQIILLRSS